MFYARLNDDYSITPTDDPQELGAGMDDSRRYLAQDTVGPFYISTVFIPVNMQFADGPPIHFETMIFYRGEGERIVEDYCERYVTHAEAVARHAFIVKTLRSVGAGIDSYVAFAHAIEANIEIPVPE